jgi:hypothetical protein
VRGGHPGRAGPRPGLRLVHPVRALLQGLPGHTMSPHRALDVAEGTQGELSGGLDGCWHTSSREPILGVRPLGTRAQVKPIGYTWSYLTFRTGPLVQIIGSSFHLWRLQVAPCLAAQHAHLCVWGDGNCLGQRACVCSEARNGHEPRHCQYGRQRGPSRFGERQRRRLCEAWS